MHSDSADVRTETDVARLLPLPPLPPPPPPPLSGATTIALRCYKQVRGLDPTQEGPDAPPLPLTGPGAPLLSAPGAPPLPPPAPGHPTEVSPLEMTPSPRFWQSYNARRVTDVPGETLASTHGERPGLTLREFILMKMEIILISELFE